VEAEEVPSKRRWPLSYNGISRLVAFIDVLIIMATATISGLAYHLVAFGIAGDVVRDFAKSIFVAIIFVFVTHMRRLYEPTALQALGTQLQSVVLTWTCTFIFLGGVVFSLRANEEFSRGAILLFAISGVIGLLINRVFWRAFIERALAAGSLADRKIIVIGWDFAETIPRLTTCLRRHGFRIVQQFTIADSSLAEMNSCLTSAISFVRGSDIEEIYLLSRVDRTDGINEIIERLRPLPVPVTLIPNTVTAELVRQPWRQFGDLVAVELQRLPLSAYERSVKRAADILMAGCGLFMLLPLLTILALAIKIDSPGPTLFRQTRRGFNGKHFKIFKFRTMSVLEDGPIIKQATVADSRVTRLGSFIRRTSIDELPQLINVLRGEMSIVGPRPHAVAHDDHFVRQIENYAFRHYVKPGITGWAQVHGYRGRTETLDKMRRRVEYDLWYINNWSVWLDLSILLRTLGHLVRSKNAW